MDHLVAAHAEDGGAEDALALRVHQHLHETLRLSLLHRATDAAHRARGDQGRAPRSAHLRLGHAGAPERRVDVQGIAVDAVGHPPRLGAQQVAGHDLIVVVGGVGKGAAPVALAERPHPRRAGPQGVVHPDVAAGIDLDGGRLQPQVVGVGAPPDRQQQVRADHLRRLAAARQGGRHRVPAALEAKALRLQPEPDPLALQDRRHRGRHLRRLALDQPLAAVDQRHLAAEAAEHLGELQSDVAAADDHQMLRQVGELHDRGVGQVVHLRQARKRRHEGARADVDEDPFRLQHLAAHLHPVVAREPPVALVHGAVGQRPQPPFHAGRGAPHDRVLARLHPPHVHRDAAGDHHPEFGGAARDVGGAGAGHQRLGGDAADVHAGAAEAVALDHRGAQAGGGQVRGKTGAGLPGADDDRVVCVRHQASRAVTGAGLTRAWGTLGLAGSTVSCRRPGFTTRSMSSMGTAPNNTSSPNTSAPT